MDFEETITKIEEVSEASLPDGVKTDRSYDDERQNFANWFTYHRKREYAAKFAISKVIERLEGVRMGILGINGKIIVPLKPVQAKISGTVQNEKDKLLEELHAYDSSGGTPLREGLNDVGKYLAGNSKTLTHFNGGSEEGALAPFFSEDQGGACQQCFTIVMTDGYYSYNGKKGKDIYADDDNKEPIGNADGPSDPTDFDRNALEDGLPNTLADVAMYYYENDLSPEEDGGLPDYVPTYGFDEATHQHMVTYGVAFGVQGKLNRSDYDINSIYNNDSYSVPWPADIDARQPETIDDFWHATLNARGDFYSAGNPSALIEALLALADTIAEQLDRSAAAVTINGNQLYARRDSDTLMFQSLYSNDGMGENWTGDIRAYGFDEDTGEIITSTVVWSAADELKAKPWGDRNIATYNPDIAAGVPFSYTSLSSEQKTALGAAEEIAVKRINYIKGDAVEGFRSRPDNNKLGDIVHSSPIYENDVVYVGANDGMLHAFNTKGFELTASPRYDPGEEIFAYIPSFGFGNFEEFTSASYGHKYFVDLTPTIRAGAGILENKPAVLAAASQTILVGGLGKGGRGIYALDITDPFAMNTPEKVAAKVLWEYPVNGDVDMGYSYSKPVVVQSRDITENPWIVIFGNGYGSPSGRAALYILNPAKSPGSGLLVKKIVLGGGPGNGLSSVTPVDINFDRRVDYVYAGDLKGNLWKFDLTSTNADNWDVAFYDSGIQPLFQARGPEGNPQPITSKPEVTFHNAQHGYMVLFGTGKFLGEDDFSNTQIQTVYGIWDYGDDADDTEYLGALIRDSAGNVTGLSNLPASTLQKQEISDFAYAFDNGTIADVRLLTQNKLDYVLENDITALQLDNPHSTEDNHVGWYFDLSIRERVDTDVLLREGRLIVLGFKPDEYRCRPGGGVTMFMEVDAFSGANLFEVVFDADGDNSLGGSINGGDLVKIWDDVLNKTIRLPPGGMLFAGKLHSPTILLDEVSGGGIGGGGGGGGGIEYKYMSTSAGDIKKVLEKAVVLGISNWRELHR